MINEPDARIASSLAAYGEVVAHAGGHELESLQRSDDRGAPVVTMYASPPYDLAVPPLGVARLSINLSHSQVTGGLDGDRPRDFVARRHSLFFTPAGAGAHWRKAQPSRHINIYFDDPDRHEPPLLNASLPGIRPLIEMLVAELEEGAIFEAEAVDHLARLIIVRLARRLEREASANPITPALLVRLRDHVQAHLDRRLRVADLAAVAGLPPNRFAQAFTAACRCSPHQFVIAQRLERAMHLLRASAQSLAEVAADCGFASQQHLTLLMHRRLGTTPARYRAGR